MGHKDSYLLNSNITFIFSETAPGKVMRDCAYRGYEFNHGESLQVDRCTLCSCNDGDIKCGIVDCPAIHCENPTRYTGECCEICPYCKYNENESYCIFCASN